MRRLKSGDGWFTIEDFAEHKLYAGLHPDKGVCILTRDSWRSGRWKFLILCDATYANAYTAPSVEHSPTATLTWMEETVALGQAEVLEFDTAHEFFTWAAEVTA